MLRPTAGIRANSAKSEVWPRLCGLAALSLACALLAAPSARAQSAKIAIAVSATGPGATFGAPAIDGARLAVEEANATGDAPRIDLVVEDDASNEDRGRDLARRIIASDALVVVGPATTPI